MNRGAAKKTSTHFAQIPVKIVKQIVDPPRVPRAGRRPAGIDGEPVSKYPQLAARIPRATFDRLRVVAARERRSMWRVLVDAIEAYALRKC